MLTKSYLYVKSFFQKIGKDRIYNYSASSAFFMILSIFPFLILIATIIKYTPLTEEFLIARIEFLLPDAIFPIIRQITEEVFSNTAGTTLILVSALGGIWSASKGVMSMIRGINICFNIRDHRNWVRVRLLSCLYTFVLVIAFIVIMIMLVFGSIIYNHLLNTFAYMGHFLRVIMFILRRRVLIALFVLLILFMTMYSIFPAKKNKFFQMFPGAMLASGAFVGLSELISLYVKYFPNLLCLAESKVIKASKGILIRISLSNISSVALQKRSQSELNPISTLLITAQGHGTPIIFVPSMHDSMYEAIKQNIDKIKQEGSASFIKPRMDEGKAKFPSKEDIVLESLRTINLNKAD